MCAAPLTPFEQRWKHIVLLGSRRIFSRRGVSPYEESDATTFSSNPHIFFQDSSGMGEKLLFAINATKKFAKITDVSESRQLTAAILQLRIDAWAAFVVISDTYDRILNNPQNRPVRNDISVMSAAFDKLLDAMERWDDLLQRPDVFLRLSKAIDVEQLKNWREQLAPVFAATPPWWLDEEYFPVSKPTQPFSKAASENVVVYKEGSFSFPLFSPKGETWL